MKHFILFGCICALGAQVLRAQPAAPEAKAQDADLQKPDGFAGKVVETMNAATYTYVLVDVGTNKLWVAAPQFPVTVGDSVVVRQTLPMPGYHSKTLNRDFDVVYFATSVDVNGGRPGAKKLSGELPQGHPPVGASAGKPNLDVSGIKKVEGGKTIAEIYDTKSKLKGKEVKVRGKVVKYNPEIMGKNWIHLKDGTGSRGSDDLLVTASTPVKPGDVVVATGTLAVDRDFGANYKYPVMIEDARVTVEK